MMAGFDFTCSALQCRHVREILEREAFHGKEIQFREGRGWLKRTFSVRGKEEDVHAVHQRLMLWLKFVEKS